MGAVLRHPALRFLLPAALLALVLALLASSLTSPTSAATRRVVSGWIPYWSTDAALAGFSANADLFSDVSPFWHALTSDTTVSDQENATDRGRVLAAARAAGVPVVAAITDGTGTGRLAAALADPARRAAVVATMVRLVDSRGYDGLDLDLEGFAYSDPKSTWAATRPNWVRFVADLGAALHARGKRLYATVPPTYDSNRSSTSGYWVYDYAGMAPHVDRIRIMAYDYSVGSPGPIAPYAWVQRIVTYAQTQVPRGKLVLGVPAYGRDWVTSVSGTCPAGTNPQRRSVTAAGAWQLAAAKGVPVQWDATARERTFAYTDTFSSPTTSCTVARKVYFSDGAAISERSRLAYTAQWAGVAVWSIGGEDSTTWPALRTVANGLGYPLTTGQVLEVQVAGGSTGVPGDAKAVSLNVTATGPSSAGYLTVYPCGVTAPPTSNLNFARGQTVANAVLVGVGSSGKVCVRSSAPAHVIVDGSGYFPAGSPYRAQAPARLRDTRTGAKPAAGSTTAIAAPAGIAAAALSIAVTEPSAAGWLTVFPCGTATGGTSTMNYAAGQTIAGSAIARPGADGRVCIRTSSAAHFVVDLMGVFPPGSGFTPLAPARIADTRVSPGTRVAAGAEFAVPAGVSGAALGTTLTVTAPAAGGWLQAYPCGTAAPATSNVNFAAGQTIANAAITGIGGNGRVCLRSSAATHLIVDRTAVFAGSSYFTARPPQRYADTRLP
jgi:spore germination protein YaaH